jgi:hypothetical protein
MSRRDLEDAILQASGCRHHLDVAFATEEEDSKPWQRPSHVAARINGPLPDSLTLVLAMPSSWKGTLQQYAGRLHREHADKQDVHIYDYAETDQPHSLPACGTNTSVAIEPWDTRSNRWKPLFEEAARA